MYNIDGTLNEGGSISEYVDLIMTLDGHTERLRFAVCSLGKTDIILGHLWLAVHNPEINWRTGKVALTRCPPFCGTRVPLLVGTIGCCVKSLTSF